MAKLKNFLVYQIFPCEMGSEGWSGWDYYRIVTAEDKDDAIKKWHDFEPHCKHELRKEDDEQWTCYYPVDAIELPSSVYGHAGVLEIIPHYKKHND